MDRRPARPGGGNGRVRDALLAPHRAHDSDADDRPDRGGGHPLRRAPRSQELAATAGVDERELDARGTALPAPERARARRWARAPELRAAPSLRERRAADSRLRRLLG